MTVTQIYNTLNSIIGQMTGFTAVTVTDTSSFYSLGNAVLSSNSDMDNFLNVLVDRIGKTVIRTLDVVIDFPGLLRNEFEFGAVLQKIDCQPFAAQEQKAWEIGQVGFTPDQFKIDKPTVTQTLFKDAVAWEIDVTIPDTMLKTAFTSEGAMDAFITAVFGMVESSMTMQLNYVSRGAVNGMIAEKMDLGDNVVNLLTLYNSGHTPTLTAAEALESADFYKFASRIIRNYIKYMAEPSYLYNSGTKIRATQRDNMHVLFNTSFVSGFDTYLSADTFHNEIVALPYFNEVKYWQGTGNAAPNDLDCTTIKVNTKNGDSVEAEYVIGVLADREAIGVGLFDRFTAADRNNRQRYTNYTNGATIQHFVDLSENVVIFVLDDPTVTPVGP